MTFQIIHKDTKEYIYPLNRNEVYIKLKYIGNDFPIVKITYWNYFHPNIKTSKLFESFECNNKSNNYHTTFKSSNTMKYIRYFIEIEINGEQYYYSPQGITESIPHSDFVFADVNELDIFTTPSWSQGTIGYQIFVDRFFKDSNNQINETVQWTDTPSRTNFFGGTISGIAQKISYLETIGIGLIYLTPIFESISNHKYDTTNYYVIDPNFGSIEELKYLVKMAHKHNMKVVLDGVFNHIGYYSPQFQDVIAHGVDSIYYEWFYIDGNEIDTENINYECVGYYKWMPKLRYKSLSLRQYILDIGTYWIKECNIDGWRLDVSDEVDYTFWVEFRRSIKQIKKDALLIGETWTNGYDLLRGDQLDSVMNYRFRDAVIEYVVDASINTNDFRNRIEDIYSDYPKQTHNTLYNLLGSHDTERIITRCGDNLSKLRVAVAIQFLLPGAPFIYYGDEIGLQGENDPLCRKPMDWNQIDNEVSKMYKKIIKVRQENDTIKYGDMKHIQFDTEVYGFIRTYKNQNVIVLVNPTKNKLHAKTSILINNCNINIDCDIEAFDFEIVQ